MGYEILPPQAGVEFAPLALEGRVSHWTTCGYTGWVHWPLELPNGICIIFSFGWSSLGKSPQMTVNIWKDFSPTCLAQACLTSLYLGINRFLHKPVRQKAQISALHRKRSLYPAEGFAQQQRSEGGELAITCFLIPLVKPTWKPQEQESVWYAACRGQHPGAQNQAEEEVRLDMGQMEYNQRGPGMEDHYRN